jgi:hypothetical protein
MARCPDWSEADREFATQTFRRMTNSKQNRKAIWAAIARGVGRDPGTVKQYFYNHCGSFNAETRGRRSSTRAVEGNGAYHRPSVGSIRISDALAADRDARAAAANRRTYTQEFFGDPPPGFSALEGKR